MGVGEFLGKLFAAPSGNGGELVLRAYGKLPFYAEYRRLELAPGLPTVFSQWMDAGRLAWAKAPSRQASGVTRTARLMLALPEAREFVLASVWDSRDSLGRAFPFSFFITCPVEALGADPLARFVAAGALQKAFSSFHAELSSLGRGGDFYKHYQRRILTVKPDGAAPAQAREQAVKLDAAGWMAALGLTPAAAEAWRASLARKRARWISQPETFAETAISLPLAPGLSLEAQAAVWLMWLESPLMKLSHPFSLVLPDESRPPLRLHLLARKLLPDDFQLVTTDDASYGYVENLTPQPGAGASGDPVPTAPAPAVTATPSGSLLDWLLRPV
ncbi:MAG: hypothetical protein U1D55_16715 [Phycisphaerae bacterium]